MEEYARYFNALVDISRKEACLALFNQPDLKAAPPTRRRVTSHYTPARSPLGGPDSSPLPIAHCPLPALSSASPLSGLAGQHTTLLARQDPVTVLPGTKFPDIIVDTDGCIVLCTECDSSSIWRSSDGYQCFRCGNRWSRI
jgi:hypothetical protein